MMSPLSFPPTELELKRHGSNLKVLCLIRKKWIILTPEEWVRQHVIGFLLKTKQCNPGLLAIEKSLNYQGLTKRWDILVYNTDGLAELLIECKRTNVACSKENLVQLSAYQHVVNAKKIALTNGLDCFVLGENTWNNGIDFL